MGFKGNRGPLIILIIAVLVIVGIAAAASSGGGSSHSNPEGVITVTVNGDIGVFQVEIKNLHTGKTMILPFTDLPCVFNATLSEGAVSLRLNVTSLEGYAWNYWKINQYPWFADDNPFTITVSEDLTLNGQTIAK
jgi:hypothetical protein